MLGYMNEEALIKTIETGEIIIILGAEKYYGIRELIVA